MMVDYPPQQKTPERESLEHAFQYIWEDLAEKIESARSEVKVENDNPMFRDVVQMWLGDDTYDAYIEWCEEGE